MNPAAADDRCSVSGLVSTDVTELATVISRPSRIQATPRATTIRVWKGDHGRRSIRAGIRLRMAPGAGASRVVVMEGLRARLAVLPDGSSRSGTSSIPRTFTPSGMAVVTSGRDVPQGGVLPVGDPAHGRASTAPV